MKIVWMTLALAAGLAGAQEAWDPSCSAAVVAPKVEQLVGRYIEARSASVFAGACHYSSEYTTQGRRAVCGVDLDAGHYDGVDLAGLAFVAAIASEGNLADGGARRSVLFLPEETNPERSTALLALCRTELGALLGTIERVEHTAVRVRIAGERYELRAGDAVRADGVLEPDRACCSMPQDVWYRPLLACAEPIVGRSESFAFAVEGLGARFERMDENNAFVGRLQGPSAQTSVTACN